MRTAKTGRRFFHRAIALVASMVIMTVASMRSQADQTDNCSGQMITIPFNDVLPGNVFFCAIAQAYFSGLTNGTSRTTFSPTANVTREQMAAFITRTMDQTLRRGSRRAALKQFWTPTSADSLRLTTLVNGSDQVVSDGADLWVANASGTVSRVRASDGKLLETWTGAIQAHGVLAAKGLIFVTSTGGNLYQIDPTQPAGNVTTLTNTLESGSFGIAFDGARVWTANSSGSVSIVTLNPLSVSTVTTGFDRPTGILYDGANMWVTDDPVGIGGSLFKLDSNGAIIQTVEVPHPESLVFDGTNIWVPGGTNEVIVVRASTGEVLATLSGNGLSGPKNAAFDGERIVVVGSNISLWKAADLSPLGSMSPGFPTRGVCSDGLNFWVVLYTFAPDVGKLARF